MNMKIRACELCNQKASLYCPSDSAFLCWNCDATVHQANFLVARHVRHVLCCKCNRFAQNHISGAVARLVASTCRSCSPANRYDAVDSLTYSPSSSSLSSAFVSGSESRAKVPKKITVRQEGRCTAAGRMSRSSSVTDDASSAAVKTVEPTRGRNVGNDAAAEVLVFVNWSRALGVNGNCAASLASRALGFCLRKWTGLPFRVAVATSFWLGLRFCGDKSVSTLQNLRRLEAISGVPAKLILAAQPKLARALKHRQELQEGWAEC